MACQRRGGGDQPRSPEKKPAFTRERKPALTSLRAFLAESGLKLPSELPPMAAGVFGYMGYDTVRLIEHLPNRRRTTSACPTAC